MEILDVESEVALLDDLVVEFIPSRQARKFRAWEVGDWVEVQSVDAQANGVEQ